jgi:hypothetical protein
MVESDIAVHITEMCMLQNRLLAQGGVDAMQQGQKRRGDDENYGPTYCATVASRQHSAVSPDV